MNLSKINQGKSIGAASVKAALLHHFEDVVIEYRGEPFFSHQIRCMGDGKTRLIIRFGWSSAKNRWIFEPCRAK